MDAYKMQKVSTTQNFVEIWTKIGKLGDYILPKNLNVTSQHNA